MKRLIAAVTALILALTFSLPVMASYGEELATNTHTVTFDGNGHGGTLFTLEVKDGETVYSVLTGEDDYKILWPDVVDGGVRYIVNAWYKDEACQNGFATWAERITGDVTVYAKWSKCIAEVNITVDPPTAGLTTTTEKYNDEDYYNFETQTNPPKGKVTKGACDFYPTYESGKPYLFWVEEAYTYPLRPYIGKFTYGHEYGTFMDLLADGTTDNDYEYMFSTNVKVKVNGQVVPEKYIYWDGPFIEVFSGVRLCFTDVPLSHNFQKHVYWACDEGIASGYSGDSLGKFGVADNITRGQVMMFLWRAAGKPEPAGTGKDFTDVPSSNNFYTAIKWGVEQGITGGYTGARKGEFGPNDKCTRGQIAMFLWRYSNSPNPASGGKTFSDVPKSNNFYNAVMWASGEGITAGYSDGTFGVNKSCTRGQCVTFLHRMIGD